VILQILVLIGMVSFCIWQLILEVQATGYIPITYIVTPILLLIGIHPRGILTWPLATILLLIRGHWLIGWIPAFLVVFTIYGNEWLKKKYPSDSGDIVINFHSYCKDYLLTRANLKKKQVEILLLDPELGDELDREKLKWLSVDIGLGNDPDEFLVPRLFDSPQMKRINDVLDKFASRLPEREPEIRRYLNSIGHPLGKL